MNPRDPTQRPAAVSQPRAMAPEPWKTSQAKATLRALLLDKTSWVHAHGLTVDAIHARDPIFQQYPLKRFKTNFKSLRNAVELEQDCLEFDQAAYDKEKIKFPKKTTTLLGQKVWNGSEAQALLRVAVKEGKTQDKKPADLWQEHHAYQLFSPIVFRKHKYQEERKVRENVYWQKKRNDDARKKHEAFVRKQARRSNGEEEN